jgi:hypothetical protein
MAIFAADRIKVSTTTTGTDPFGLGSATSSAFQDFDAASVPDGSTIHYSAYTATEFECGAGIYDEGGATLSRDTIFASSNTGLIVTFGSSPTLVVSPLAADLPREKLTASRTYYVRTDGDDDNDGLADSSARAFLTWQRAIDVVENTLDFAGNTVTIEHGNEAGTKTFTGSIILNIHGWVGGGILVIDGISASTCVLSSSSFTIFTSGVLGTGTLIIRNFKIESSGGSGCLHSAVGSLNFTDGMEWGDCTPWHMQAHHGGCAIFVNGTNVISGDALAHFFCAAHGVIFHEATVSTTLTGTPAFGVAFAFAVSGGLIQSHGQTFIGSATGSRYNSQQNAIISTDSGGASYFPGDSVGSTATGGIYV